MTVMVFIYVYMTHNRQTVKTSKNYTCSGYKSGVVSRYNRLKLIL